MKKDQVSLSSLTQGEAFLAGMLDALMRRVDKLEGQVNDLSRALEVLHWGIVAGEPRTRVKCRKKITKSKKGKK